MAVDGGALWAGTCDRVRYVEGRFAFTFFFVTLEGDEKLNMGGDVQFSYDFGPEPKRGISLVYRGPIVADALTPNAHDSVVRSSDDRDLQPGPTSVWDPELHFGFADPVWDSIVGSTWLGARALTSSAEYVFFGQSPNEYVFSGGGRVLEAAEAVIRERLRSEGESDPVAIEFENTRIIRPGVHTPAVYSLKQRT